MKQFSEVQKIVIFGSSVTSARNPWSDIDAYVELSKEVTMKRPALSVPLDLWTKMIDY